MAAVGCGDNHSPRKAKASTKAFSLELSEIVVNWYVARLFIF